MAAKISNSIFDELSKSSLLYMSLTGVRTLLERELLLKDLILDTEDSAIKEIQRRISDKGGLIAYPYAYLELSEMTAIKDGVPNKNIKRHGFTMSTFNVGKATVMKAYVFPLTVQVSLHYLDNDPLRVLRMCEALIILGQIGPLNFSLHIGESFEREVGVEIPESATIPIAEADNPQHPGAQEVVVPLIIHAYTGFFRDVAAVGSDRPTLSFDLKQNYLPSGEGHGA